MVISGASELQVGRVSRSSNHSPYIPKSNDLFLTQACRPANYYRRLAKIEPTPVVIDQIDADLPRTFPNHPWIQDEGQEPLRRILIAFAMHNVSLGYTQGLNSVAALLLLAADREEETTFWLLNALVQGKVAPDTYAPTLAGAHIEMNTLGVLVEEKCPNIAKHFDRMKEPKCIPALYSTEWFICLFSTSFPSETTARVWDCLFNEGSKILFRVALSILKLSEQQLMSCDHSGDVLETIKEAAANMHNHNKLMTMAMDGLGSFPQSRIDKIRSEESVHVNAMLADLEAQRRKRELKSKLEAEQRRRDMEAERQMEQDIPDSRADEIQKAAKATAEKTKDVLTKGFGFIAAGVKKLGQDAMNGFPMPQDDEAPRPSKQGKASRYDDEDDEEDGGWDERQRGLPKRPPPRPSASTSTAASSVSRANAAAEETRRKLVERGEKLKGVDERVSEMTNEASGFADLAEKLKQQQRRQGPWGGLFS